jgi:hypothetical protein
LIKKNSVITKSKIAQFEGKNKSMIQIWKWDVLGVSTCIYGLTLTFASPSGPSSLGCFPLPVPQLF